MREREPMAGVVSRTIDVGGIRTHFLEAGPANGPDVVLLHSGEFGADSELCWELILPALAERHHVIAPDWLGYGGTDKLYDFEGGSARRVRHLTEFLREIGVEHAVFIGSSMGGSTLARVAASETPAWEMDAVVLLSGGGFPPHNEHRQVLLDYDGTAEAMRAMMRAIFHDPTWALEDSYIERRVELSNRPGVWECAAAARFKNPQLPAISQFGRPDETPYELISVPTLIIAGADDKLREPGYADELGRRIPDSRVHVYDGCGHMPSLESPQRTAHDILAFLAELSGQGAPVAGTTPRAD